MRALVLERFAGPLEVRDVPAPDPSPSGAVVEVGATGDRYATPTVVLTIPQVARVGRTWAEAQKAGLPHRVVEIPLEVAG